TAPERVFGANDRVQVAIIGLHGRGNDHIKELSRNPHAQIAAFCDIDPTVLNQRLQQVEKQGLSKPKTYADIRKLLEDKSIEGIKQINDGLIGDVYLARGLCYKWRDTIGRAPEEAVPAGVNYDLWTGPAPMKPFTKNRFHYNWHWIWDTGNGDIGNQGVHEMDKARWGLGVNYPTKVSAIGG